MSIRLLYEYVKDKFEEAGYELLSTEYVNNGTKCCVNVTKIIYSTKL